MQNLVPDTDIRNLGQVTSRKLDAKLHFSYIKRTV